MAEKSVIEQERDGYRDELIHLKQEKMNRESEKKNGRLHIRFHVFLPAADIISKLINTIIIRILDCTNVMLLQVSQTYVLCLVMGGSFPLKYRQNKIARG